MSRRDYPPDDRYDDRQSNLSRRPRGERNYDEVDVDIRQSRYDGPPPSRYDGPQRSRRNETMVKESDTVMTQGHRTERPSRQRPDFLQEDYGRNPNAGQLVVREERREEDDYVSRAPPRRRSVDSVRSRRPPPQGERVERDEFIFKETERDRGGPPYPQSQRGSFGEEDKFIFRERTRSRGPPMDRGGRTREEIDIRIREDDRRPAPPRDDYQERDVEIRRGGGGRPPPPRGAEVEKEEIIFRETRSPVQREPPRGGDVRKEEIDIDIRDRGRREDIDIDIRERGRGRNENIDIDIREQSAPPPRQRSVSRGNLVRKDHEEWVVRRRRTPSPSPPREVEKEQIIIRRRERSPSPIPEPPREPTPPPPTPPPAPVYRPPIIQEVITHHRHIDHGIERARSPTPPPAPAPPPPQEKEDDLEISIRRQGTRNGRAYDEEIDIDIDRKERSGRDASRNVSRNVSRDVARRRSPSRSPAPPARRRYDDDVAGEADYYNRRVASRAYPGEAWNGATKDWGLVDIPPGTEKVRMDGTGGGRQEITWGRYDGERRGKFYTAGEVYGDDWGNGTRSPVPAPLPPPGREVERDIRISETRRVEESGTPSRRRERDRMWTEVSKDLVIKEAIEERGYEYEETDQYFYVLEYLRYVRPPPQAPKNYRPFANVSIGGRPQARRDDR